MGVLDALVSSVAIGRGPRCGACRIRGPRGVERIGRELTGCSRAPGRSGGAAPRRHLDLDPLRRPAGRLVRLAPAGLGPDGRRIRLSRGRLRVPARERHLAARPSAPWSRTRAARATAPPARHRLRRDVRPAAPPTATCCSSTSAAPASAARSTARRCSTSRAPTPRPRPPARSQLGDRSDLYGSALSADDLSAVITALRPRPGRHVRRLVRHVLHPGLPRSPPGPAAQPHPRLGLPDVRRGRVVRDAGTGDDELVREGLRAHAVVRGRSAARPSAGWRSCSTSSGRKPLRGKATGADGRMHKVTIGAADLTYARVQRDVHARPPTASSTLRSGPRSPATPARSRGWWRRTTSSAATGPPHGLQRGPGRCRVLPGLPAALRHEPAPGGPAAAVRRGRRGQAAHATRTSTGRSPLTSTSPRAGASRTGACSGRSRTRPTGRRAGAAGRSLRRRPDPGAVG